MISKYSKLFSDFFLMDLRDLFKHTKESKECSFIQKNALQKKLLYWKKFNYILKYIKIENSYLNCYNCWKQFFVETKILLWKKMFKRTFN